ncbi:MAG TPA: phage tail tape measure protein [Mycobacterium sp.]|nr:phage tail tape measure protein [Mycobacterium sp.]
MSSRELNILIKAKNLTSGAIKGVKSELKGLNKTLGKGLSSAWRNTERGIVIGAGAAAGAVGYAAAKAIEWEDAFAGVRKTMNEADLKKVGSSFDQLGDDFRAMAREMPVTAAQFAAIGESAGALGIAAQDVKPFTRTVAELGVTTDLTFESASDSLGHLGNVLHLAGNDFGELGDSLVALGNNGASTESQIIGIAERFGAAGHSAGLAKEDILALASTTASMGIDVEAGGSALSRVFNGIATNIGTGSAKAKAFAKVLGLSAKQFKTAWKRDALGTFEDFLKELDKMDQFDAAATLKSIGITNTRDVNAIRLLSSGYKELNKQLDVSRNAAGAMDKEAQQRFATTKSQLQILKNNLDDAAITIGSALLPKINELAHKATDWLKGHQPEIKQFANDLAKGFESAVTWASKLDWEAIGNTLKTVGGVGKTLLDTFLSMPSWVQVAVATGWGLNKFTGGMVGTLVGEIGKGIVKGVFNMNAGVVNVKGAVVNAPGGGGLGGTPIAGGGKSTLGKVAGGIGKYVLGPAGAVIAGSEIAAQVNAPKINPALDFEKQQLQVKLDSDDLKSLEATLSTLKSARDTSTGKDPLKEIAIGLSYVPFISDALGHIGPELDSQIKEVQKKIDELKAAQKASNTVTDGILNHNADEHNAVVTRANQQASQSVTRQIQSHAASERSDLRDLQHATRSVETASRAIPPHLSRIEGASAETARYTGIVSRKDFSPRINVTANFSAQVRVSVNSVARALTSMHIATGQAGGPGGFLQ